MVDQNYFIKLASLDNLATESEKKSHLEEKGFCFFLLKEKEIFY